MIKRVFKIILIFRYIHLSTQSLLKNHNQSVAKKLRELENPDGSYRFDSFDIANLSKMKINQRIVDKCVNMKKNDGEYTFSGADIAYLADPERNQNVVIKYIDLKYDI